MYRTMELFVHNYGNGADSKGVFDYAQGLEDRSGSGRSPTVELHTDDP